ncbi:ABC transporter, ATP-binding protein [Vibrio nigripulchritudo MADA3029]|uniref:ABC transporter permease subunit n=1 Tax=Vibrio nigripulchritudo TaxID=28173 RepID=UPI0003B23D9E|nr:ATP-binding cassette domain-containing protein [Vibrio nigripulchritudo]CCN50892.1 ABC transporter, ATP-binding protein [Vibrio nigripulchritudo MADA3020]CCN56750.1 ABC transporter, ATP-binding protein [Vibrio nigripulchritudo MADA3021]CCN62607.1 ABC transporter, ATP-binding protein [Vibrio nigripulchritudo MADA3029]
MFEKVYSASGWLFPVLLVVFGLAIADVIDPYLAYVGTSWLIFGLLGLSLDVVWGRGGFLSLGQTAFYGVGGYLASVAAINLSSLSGNTLIWSLPIGALSGAGLAAILAWVIFYARMGALQSTILSYTFTLLLWSLAQTFKLNIGDAVIGGDNGMSNIPGIATEFGSQIQPLDPSSTFAVVLLIAGICYLLTYFLMQSHFGKVVDCIRIDHQKAELLGYDIRKFQLITYSYSGAIAGVAGALFGAWSNYLNPSIFSVQEALLVPIYVLVGGIGTLMGPFIGAIAIGGLSFWLGGGAVGGQTTLVLGVILILLVLFLRNGILGALKSLVSPLLPKQDVMPQQDAAVDIDHQQLQVLMEKCTKQRSQSTGLATNKAYKAFGGVVPVNDVSLQFSRGKPFSLIGPNGAGKSSYLKTCAGLYMAEKGEVLIGSTPITKCLIFERVRLGMGIKNQKPQIFGEKTVIENLWIAAFAPSRDQKQATEISESILTMFGLNAYRDVPASALAHGKQQWLDIGMVLCLMPQVILLDEPAAGMTNEETRELAELAKTMARFATVVLVEHDMEFVRQLQGDVAVLHMGQVFATGTVESLREDERVLDIYLGRKAHA